MRRSLDAVRPLAEIDAAEIEPEDLLLGVFLLQLDGVDQLLALPLQGTVGGEEEVSGQLLGDGRSAFANK